MRDGQTQPVSARRIDARDWNENATAPRVVNDARGGVRGKKRLENRNLKNGCDDQFGYK
jgi:hypothetical protein